jgi:hypothetical protein
MNSPVSIRRPEDVTSLSDEDEELDIAHLSNLQRFIKIISHEVMKLFVDVKRRNN